MKKNGKDLFNFCKLKRNVVRGLSKNIVKI